MITNAGTHIISGAWCDYEVAVRRDGEFYYPLTVCCGAVATGSDGATCCRVCYQEVDSMFGSCWTQEQFQRMTAQ